MNAATTGDTYNFQILNSQTGTPQVLTGYTVTCAVLPPEQVNGGVAYGWPGALNIVSATLGEVQLITTPLSFPSGGIDINNAFYYLQFAGSNGSTIVWKSRLFPIQIAKSIF